MFFNKLFEKIKRRGHAADQNLGKTQEKQEPHDAPPIRAGLNQDITFGTNGSGQVAEVVLNDPAHKYRKVIVNHDGFFEDFPGVIQENWTRYLKGNFDFDRGRVCYRTRFEPHDGGYRCLWEIQPDGFYWADEEGFGAEDDSEIVLYADLDAEGVFKGPFHIYTIEGRRVEEESAAEREETQPVPAIEQMVRMLLDKMYEEVCAKRPEKGSLEPVSFYFRVPDSAFLAYVQVQGDIDMDRWSMKVFVRKEYSDRAYNHFYPSMSGHNMMAYLQGEEAVEEISGSIRKLMDG